MPRGTRSILSRLRHHIGRWDPTTFLTVQVRNFCQDFFSCLCMRMVTRAVEWPLRNIANTAAFLTFLVVAG